jgi:hypothetical protein
MLYACSHLDAVVREEDGVMQVYSHAVVQLCLDYAGTTYFSSAATQIQ